ncbi:MAG: hypothetical protein IPH58_03210 [Sphingobacteriales bacterium]|nr:hypothetical protein [Sphingobacteriales bacterium]
MSLKSIKDYEEQRNKRLAGMRSLLVYAMGLLFVLLGAFVIYRYKADTTYTVLGVVIVLYGVWRTIKALKGREN